MQTGFWWILLAVFVYGVIHSVLAALRTKENVKDWIGRRTYQRFYRLFFSLQAAVFFVPILVMVAVLPDSVIYRIPFPWVILTVIIQIAAVILMAHSVMLTGAMRFVGLKQAADPETAEKSLPLVRKGMYRYVRHPLYFLTFVIIWLLPTMSWNVLALNIGITLYMLVGAVLEEGKLRREFGREYDEYRKKTPFVIPGLKFNNNQN